MSIDYEIKLSLGIKTLYLLSEFYIYRILIKLRGDKSPSKKLGSILGFAPG
jgi:hypothetical protein